MTAKAVIDQRQRFAIALRRRGFAELFPSEVARSVYLDAIEEVYGRKAREKAEGEMGSEEAYSSEQSK